MLSVEEKLDHGLTTSIIEISNKTLRLEKPIFCSLDEDWSWSCHLISTLLFIPYWSLLILGDLLFLANPNVYFLWSLIWSERSLSPIRISLSPYSIRKGLEFSSCMCFLNISFFLPNGFTYLLMSYESSSLLWSITRVSAQLSESFGLLYICNLSFIPTLENSR